MSRLNLNHLSDLIHTELVMPPSALPGREGGQTGSFVEHLVQATQTVGRSTGTKPPPTADSRPENRDDRPSASGPLASESRGDTARQADPTDGEQDRQRAGESRAESEPKTNACENPSECDPEAGASETRSDCNQETGPSEGEHAGEQEDDRGEGAPNAETAAAAGMAGEPRNRQAVPGADSAAEENNTESHGQAHPVKPTHGKTPSDATGTLVATASEEVKVATEQNAPQDEPTGQQDSTRTQEVKNTGPKAAPQLLQPDEAAGQPGDDASQMSAVDASSQKHKAASGPRRQARAQGAGSSVAGHPGNNPSAHSAPDGASASIHQDARSTPDTALPTDAKGGIAPLPADPNSPGQREGETAAPTRVEADQGPRRTSATPRAEPSGSDQVDRVRFVQRVARAFEMLGQRGGSVRLRLHPPELGSLRLEVSVRNGAMSARLEVETASARNMLLDNLPALRQRLAEQDIRMERFDVDLTDRPFGGSPQRPSDQPPSHHDPQGNTPGAGSDPRGEGERAAQPRAVARPSEGSRLDVII